jgi:hypothetical protein
MNFYKISFFTTLFTFFSFIAINIYFISLNPNFITPTSDQNDFTNKLNYSLFTNTLKPNKIIPRLYQNEIEFTLTVADKPSTVIFSTLRNPYWQVSSLQKLQKLAKIRDKYVYLIDLSDDHPYATLKNN